MTATRHASALLYRKRACTAESRMPTSAPVSIEPPPSKRLGPAYLFHWPAWPVPPQTERLRDETPAKVFSFGGERRFLSARPISQRDLGLSTQGRARRSEERLARSDVLRRLAVVLFGALSCGRVAIREQVKEVAVASSRHGRRIVVVAAVGDGIEELSKTTDTGAQDRHTEEQRLGRNQAECFAQRRNKGNVARHPQYRAPLALDVRDCRGPIVDQGHMARKPHG